MDNQDKHNLTDEQLQKKQNALIDRNTKITLVLGALAILLQLLDVLINFYD